MGSTSTNTARAPVLAVRRHRPGQQNFPYLRQRKTPRPLRQWLVKYYSTSTFNTCEHQPLATMDGPPLRTMISPDAEPVAHHKAIPVPLHWQTDIKPALDRDVRLGVIEPVPVGQPVTGHMLVPSDGGRLKEIWQPSPLRRPATPQPRLCHKRDVSNPSPFHQARFVPWSTYKTVLDAWNGYHSRRVPCIRKIGISSHS